MSTPMGPPLPPQNQIFVAVFTLDTDYTFTNPKNWRRNIDELVVETIGVDINIKGHVFLYADSRPPPISTLRIEEVIRNPSASPYQPWRDLIKPSSTIVTLYVLPSDHP